MIALIITVIIAIAMSALAWASIKWGDEFDEEDEPKCPYCQSSDVEYVTVHYAQGWEQALKCNVCDYYSL